MTRTPFLKDLTDTELVDAYWAARQSAYSWSELAPSCNPRSAAGRKVAGGWGRAMRHVEIIEAIARKRGLSLRRAA
jgi:hypothetical protein